ncbi:protein new-glue 1-like [Drosophila miranda]|uniref:protein new-glue 1-like n=1 Tax=Drosophila miranda TaxID=7229 RepID=UPI0007E63702|nr:protein new-glue 1-like [Drosophila miranda]XP_017156860.1 protein new-glue 1-like [Drosophila miranda]
MKFLFVVVLIALAIQLTVAQSSTTTTEAATTTTTAASTDTTTTTAASVTSATTKKTNKLCWRGNNWCNTRQQVKCKNPKNCIKTIVVVRRHRG